MRRKHIIVVGGGPAGIMAAIQASGRRQKVTLIEKNSSLGKKLLLTGKGRCNLTNLSNLDSFLKRFSKGGQFLRDAFKSLFNRALIDFFQSKGLELKVERQLRVFPATDSARSVLEVLKRELRRMNVGILYNSQVKEILLKAGKTHKVKLKDGTLISADSIILATGGISRVATGSTGDGFKIAKSLGHHLIDLKPGLIPLVIKEKYPKILEGLTLKNIRIIFSSGKKKLSSEIGELLFTDFGISGPLVLSLSAQVVDWLGKGKEVHVEVDLKPGLTKEKIEERILREIKQNPKKTINNLLKSLLPANLINVFLDISRVDGDRIVSYITHKERKALAALFKAMDFKISQACPINLGMITRGGVCLKEINPRTMQSRLVKGLYFAGEIIDVDADTGGFNLQAAFSTGYLAGESAAK